MHQTRRQVTGQAIDPLDFRDDRLAHLLKHLSTPRYWQGIEQELTERGIAVYDLPAAVIRCEAPTGPGYHAAVDEGLFPFGHSKEAPSRAQINLMPGSLEPLGMPVASDVLSGARADDGLYLPLIERRPASLKQSGLLFVGDCKMSAFALRAPLAGQQQYDLSPLPLTGATTEQMEAWSSQGVAKDQAGELHAITRKNDQEEEVRVAQG